MGEINPISAKGIDPKLFKQFRDDLELVLTWETQENIGSRMGILRSNINRYIKGYLPVTKGFLKKFYAAWGDKLNENRVAEDPSLQIQDKQERTLLEIFTILQRIESKIDRQSGQ